MISWIFLVFVFAVQLEDSRESGFRLGRRVDGGPKPGVGLKVREARGVSVAILGKCEKESFGFVLGKWASRGGEALLEHPNVRGSRLKVDEFLGRLFPPNRVPLVQEVPVREHFRHIVNDIFGGQGGELLMC